MKPLKISLSIVAAAAMLGGVMTGPADAHPHQRVDCFKVGGCPGINPHHRHWWGHHAGDGVGAIITGVGGIPARAGTIDITPAGRRWFPPT
jgi:hypothetical protein